MMNGTTAERNGAAAGIQTCTKDNDVVSSVSDSPESVAEPTATAPTAESVPDANTTPNPIVSSTKKSRPPYQYDPHKITLRFLFANRDGLTVTVECEPNDTVGQVKGALLSVWPTDLPTCDGSDRVRLICMGKGYLMPDTRTLEDCQIPVFKTHPTPVNVSVLPVDNAVEEAHGKKDTRKKKESTHTGGHARHARTNAARSPTNDGAATAAVNQGCACILL
jgi:hypothetical protein